MEAAYRRLAEGFVAYGPGYNDKLETSNLLAQWDHDGKVLVVEMVVPDGNEPSISKLLDLSMLVIAPGQERTADEYGTLFQKADFALTRIVPTMSPYGILEGVAV